MHGPWVTGSKSPSSSTRSHSHSRVMELISPPSPRPAFRAGVQHYLSGARASALRCWEHAAEIGSVDAHFAVAVLGDEPTADALRRLLACYDAGHGMTEVMLGLYSYLGICGMPRDDVVAHEYWRKAAGDGEIRALYMLAVMHEERGDFVAARRLLEVAGRGGLRPAFSRLAIYFVMGLGGLSEDVDLGMRMLRRASADGEPTAKEFLITCYEEGVGVEKDTDAAWREIEEYWKWIQERPPRDLCSNLDLVGWLIDAQTDR
jgi:TPR repeat protein